MSSQMKLSEPFPSDKHWAIELWSPQMAVVRQIVLQMAKSVQMDNHNKCFELTLPEGANVTGQSNIISASIRIIDCLYFLQLFMTSVL